ncbi:alpha-N-arabinofuranosidase [Haloferax sp. Atlit-47N]|uniref:Alpha-L-arabinofuranosidase C-terminal domain-containing protein n=2 Tax=Haloferax TaxID=2251 RepID=A0ACD5I2Z8_9EURY|nr:MULTISPECIES: alpha-L-arabinofuranosidase C-terminal domain-containing protein [Haloferax]RDZ30846.1 alpha-N-arabinofuranosidase [Haloferax sp. Atlit-48N]RDZ38522.1 alpha-N-arabinofuranosidase [Haloferax sp. Atlit-47N]TVT94589.1 alpha-N-arabinofuranosidase [Haloferax volcanii]
MQSEVRVSSHEPIDRISENIYGHFAEHLGRCIYGGLWVGDDDRVETEDGIRMDTVSLLRGLNMPVLRWPGGCFADDYHWEDGVGPRDERPRRRNLWWTQGRENIPEESNEFGTDEFLRLCQLLDTDPYIAVNVGSSTPQEALDWIEYCNYGGDTELANRRRENGQEEPYGVKYWGIGNENWGCGGRFAPDEYADEYRRFANYFNGFDKLMNEESTEFIACGHLTDDWNKVFFDSLNGGMEYGPGSFLGMGSPFNLMDHFSVHRYYQAGGDTDFTDEQYYKIFARAQKVGGDIDRAAETISQYVPEDEIGIIVDEWGVWHPEARSDNGLEQENTVRDALTTAGVLDLIHERADVVSMANIAQLVNVLQCLVQTDEEDAWRTPTYRVFDLYENHVGRTALETSVDTEQRTIEGEENDVPMVSASASEGDGELFVTASNRRHDEPETLTVDVGSSAYSVSSATVLFEGNDIREYSTKENADSFEADVLDVTDEGDGTVTFDAPPASVVGLTLTE